MSFNITSRSNENCPPTDNYKVVIKEVGELRTSEGFPDKKDGIIKYDTQQSLWKFEIIDYEYDVDDEDDYNWNGEVITQYFTFFTTYRDTGKTNDTYLSERGKLKPFLTALLGVAPTAQDDIDLESFIGRKLTVRIEPKDSGKPDLSSPVAVKARRQRPAPEPVAVVEVDDDDEEDDFDEVTRSDKAA